MLRSSKQIRDSAQRLAKRLEDEYKDHTGEEWTKHIFKLLTDFCSVEFKQKKLAFFHNHHPEGRNEFMWDFLAVADDGGILLAAESEQHYNTAAERGLRHDFGKLLYVYAPLRALIYKAKDEDAAERLRVELTEYANACCTNFNPGSVFLLHCCLWHGKGSHTYLWQSAGEPAELRKESLDFVLLEP